MGREPFLIASALDNYLVAGVGQLVEGAATEDGVVEEASHLLHGPVAGNDEAGDPLVAKW